MRLLVTRPEPDAERTAAALRARGHEALVAPIMRIEAITEADPGSAPWAAVLVTSANAADAIARHPRMAELRALPVFAVGRRSAEAARAAGFAAVTSADGDARDLARLVAARVPARSMLLYLAGEKRAGDLAADLPNHQVHTLAIYRAVAVPPSAEHAESVAGVLHYSRRAAQMYVEAARATGRLRAALAPVHFCLAARVVEPLSAAGAPDIRVASRPEEAALLELIGPA